jgi:hypothetical protein
MNNLMKCLWLFSAVWALWSGPTQARDMDFRLVPFGDKASCRGQQCVFVITADGDITADTPQRFKTFVTTSMKDPRSRAVVFINSAGGSVTASMELGQMFRAFGVLAIIGHLEQIQDGEPVSTYVPGGRCYSACVYAFIGAKKRIVPPSSVLGIHRMYSYELDGDDITNATSVHKIYGNKEFVARLANYAPKMGVSRTMVREAEKIDSDKIRIVSTRELAQWKIGSRNF